MEEISKEDIEQELKKNDGYEFDSLDECINSYIVFTIFCEKVISLNESYTVENLAETYKSDVQETVDIETFVEQKFQQVTTPELREIFGIANKNKYVEYTARGIEERLTEGDNND